MYCTRRDSCVKLAELIRTHLQDRDMDNEGRLKGRKKMSFTAEPYHAGLTPARRRTVQNAFMAGKLRIVVATVAFGMGIDKSDIRDGQRGRRGFKFFIRHFQFGGPNLEMVTPVL